MQLVSDLILKWIADLYLLLEMKDKNFWNTLPISALRLDTINTSTGSLYSLFRAPARKTLQLAGFWQT
jgi:hypothetical protein